MTTTRTSLSSKLRNAARAGFPERRLRHLVGDAADITTHMSVQERCALFSAVWSYCQEGRCLEIGSYLGASACVMSAALLRRADTSSTVCVYCIDTWQNDAMGSEPNRDTWTEFKQNTKKFQSVITTVRGYSHEVAMPQESMDLIFIDGDHSYEGAKRDIDLTSHLVRPGGALAFHDANRPPVARAIGELLCDGNWLFASMTGTLVIISRSNKNGEEDAS